MLSLLLSWGSSIAIWLGQLLCQVGLQCVLSFALWRKLKKMGLEHALAISVSLVALLLAVLTFFWFFLSDGGLGLALLWAMAPLVFGGNFIHAMEE